MRTPVLLTLLLLGAELCAQGSIRFFGNGVNAPDQDRVKIPIDDPATNLPGPPADVGATDFTIECWVKGLLADNTAPLIACGANVDWILGNILFDRDRYNAGRKFGISFGAGRPVFGVTGVAGDDRTICGGATILDGQWHHLAVQRRRSDGWLWLYVDGVLQSQADGPNGDISYPDNGVPGNYCGGPCVNSDPFIVLGAEKHDAGAAYPSFNGFLDELRISTVLRDSGPSFPVPAQPFSPDAQTAALYHFDEGGGTLVNDVSGAPGGPSNGFLNVGGSPPGPQWSSDTPFPSANLLDVRLALGGCFDGLTALMRDDLRTAGLLPLAEPYTALGYAHAGGGGGESTTPAQLALTGNDAVVDWVYLELLQATPPYTPVATRCALLRRDGRVTSPASTDPVSFGSFNGTCYLRVRHRSHLRVTAAGLVQPSPAAPLIDLRSAPVLGGAALRIDINGTLCLWPGDVNNDGLVQYVGAGNDRDPVLVAVGGGVPTSSAPGYASTDVNLDGLTRYVGAGNDRDPMLVAAGGSVPTNVLQAVDP
ncbi:MAG: LamG domain-containing protein [Flavobacteriales bacterium]